MEQTNEWYFFKRIFLSNKNKNFSNYNFDIYLLQFVYIDQRITILNVKSDAFKTYYYRPK